MKYSVSKDQKQPTKLFITITDDADKLLRRTEYECLATTTAAEVIDFIKYAMVDTQKQTDAVAALKTATDAVKTTVTSLSIAPATVTDADLTAFKTSKGLL